MEVMEVIEAMEASGRKIETTTTSAIEKDDELTQSE